MPVRAPDNVYRVFCLDVESVEGWLWYYTVWYRYGTRLMAEAHKWSDPRIVVCDKDARALFKRSILHAVS